MSAFKDCRDASPWADGDTTDDELDVAVYFFNAARAHQREVDAVIAWSTGMKLFRKKPDEREVGAACAEAIREQKIDD